MQKMVKRITLVTWKGMYNFGTCLQSYGLYVKLMQLGYIVKFLAHRPLNFSLKYYLKQICKDVGGDYLLSIIRGPQKTLQLKKIEKFQKSVFDNYYIKSSWHDKKMIKETDCFIAGSDQIWNTYFNFNPVFFLSFAKNKKRISYASSIGTNSIKSECKDEVKKLLMEFAHISVRENTAVKILSELTGRNDVCQVIDPTFLLSQQEWKDMSKGAVFETPLPDNYILCYLVGNNDRYAQQLLEVKNKLGIENVIIIPSAENSCFRADNCIVYKNASPVEFVWLIQHALFVCTDSFHATALSINNSISFVEFIRFKDSDVVSQNSRIYDLLNHYELKSRIYSPESDVWTKSINFKSVQEILDNDRKESLNYLLNAIEK